MPFSFIPKAVTADRIPLSMRAGVICVYFLLILSYTSQIRLSVDPLYLRTWWTLCARALTGQCLDPVAYWCMVSPILPFF